MRIAILMIFCSVTGFSLSASAQESNQCKDLSIRVNAGPSDKICYTNVFDINGSPAMIETIVYSEDDIIVSVTHSKASTGHAVGKADADSFGKPTGETARHGQYDLTYYWSEDGGSLGGPCNGVLFVASPSPNESVVGAICQNADEQARLSDTVVREILDSVQTPF